MEESIYRSGEYLEKNPTYHVEDSPWKAQQILKMMRRHHLLLEARTICEIGCGAGEILKQLQAHLPLTTELYGYEISPQGFSLCSGRANERLRFYCEDLLSSEAGPFDLLLCIDVFEHVEDYFGFLRKLRPKARQQIFHIPLDLSAQSVARAGPVMLERAEVGHLHYFMKETALATLRDTGYEVLDWFYTPGALNNPRSIKARLASLPRKICSLVNQDLTVRVLGGYSLMVLTRARRNDEG
jgi:cyclopropane fatty-acyl-phospholipid synthase-like methyltransferase